MVFTPQHGNQYYGIFEIKNEKKYINLLTD